MGLQIYAGPILRRVSARKVVIWVATIGSPNISGKLVLDAQVIGIGYSNSISVNDKISIHLIEILPTYEKGSYSTFNKQLHQAIAGMSFPINTVVSYTIGIPSGNSYDYEDFNAIVIDRKLAYGNEDWYQTESRVKKTLNNEKPKLPDFIIHPANKKLNIVFGSCRKPHDKNADAFEKLDGYLRDNHGKVDNRPHMLCLGGDQIYADDVHDAVINAIKKISGKYGLEEVLPKTGMATDAMKDRSGLIKKIGFTSGEGKNHLLSFGDYIAMYGLVWNAENWRGLPSTSLDDFLQGLISAARVMANTPTYMIFDDHDVTDDWFITNDQKKAILANETGRRVIANAMAAYFLFQGWGNSPETFDFSKSKTVIENRNVNSDFDSFFLAGNWEFATPTLPVTYFLDTRTKRGGSGFPPLLKSQDSWSHTKINIQNKNMPFVLIAPGPLVTFSGIDKVQRDASKWPDNPWLGVVGTYGADFESWAANPNNYKMFFEYFKKNNVSKIVVLSGDVHYGFSAVFSIYDKGALLGLPNGYRLNCLQITSSALKNSASVLSFFSHNGYNGSLYLLIFNDRFAYAYEQANNKVFLHKEKPRYVIDQNKIKQLIGNNNDSLYEALSTDFYPELIVEIKINSSIPKTAGYVADHNYGLVSIDQNQIKYSFNNGMKYSYSL